MLVLLGDLAPLLSATVLTPPELEQLHADLELMATSINKAHALVAGLITDVEGGTTSQVGQALLSMLATLGVLAPNRVERWANIARWVATNQDMSDRMAPR